MAIHYLIPARSGSKGLAMKNLAKVGDQSLLELAICAASNSKEVGTIWVTSDSEAFLEIARKSGARGHLRDSAAASDSATADDVVIDFLGSHVTNGEDVIVYLQPTSPFRKSKDIDEAIRLFRFHQGQPVVAVTEISQHPEKAVRLQRNRLVSYLPTKKQSRNRQSLERLYIPNGAIYVFSVETFRAEQSIPVHGSIAYEMSPAASIDIDTHMDILFANFIHIKESGQDEK